MTSTEKPSDPAAYTISELAEQSGVEPRTIRSYVEKGIIPGPDSLGRAARYPRESLDRLKVLQLLRDANRGLTLDQLRMLLQSLGPAEVSGLADGRIRIGALLDTAAGSESTPSAAIDYLRSLRSHGALLNAHSPPASALRRDVDDRLPVLEEAARALARLAGLANASRGVRGEHWYRLPLTPDIELSVRGSFGSDQLAQFHRIGDALRLLLTKGPRT
jgi:DNA-binding transcriptional MerR regulator